MRYKLEIREIPKRVFAYQQYSYIIIDTETGNHVNAVATQERVDWLLNMRNSKDGNST